MTTEDSPPSEGVFCSLLKETHTKVNTEQTLTPTQQNCVKLFITSPQHTNAASKNTKQPSFHSPLNIADTDTTHPSYPPPTRRRSV